MKLLVRGDLVLFAGEDSELSNLCKTHISTKLLTGVTVNFNSVEQGYQWAKLHYVGLHEDADLLLKLDEPRQAMKFARHSISHYRAMNDHPKVWYMEQRLVMWRDFYAEQVLLDLILRKAKRDRRFEYNLSIYKDKTFAEATKDCHWGWGINTNQAQRFSEKDIRLSKYGENRMGELLSQAAEMMDHWRIHGQIVSPLIYDNFLKSKDISNN